MQRLYNTLRKTMKPLIIYLLTYTLLTAISYSRSSIEKYSIYEITFIEAVDGNPFQDVQLVTVLEHDDISREVNGFYDGVGRFIIGFMPHLEGTWSYQIKSNLPNLTNKTGSFECVQSSDNYYVICDWMFYNELNLVGPTLAVSTNLELCPDIFINDVYQLNGSSII